MKEELLKQMEKCGTESCRLLNAPKEPKDFRGGVQTYRDSRSALLRSSLHSTNPGARHATSLELSFFVCHLWMTTSLILDDAVRIKCYP